MSYWEDEMSYWEERIHRDYQTVSAKAASENKKVVVAGDRVLQIDIDSEWDFAERWQKTWIMLLPEIKDPDSEVVITVSSSRLPHRHITVFLKEPMEIWKRIALQLLLGSDIQRETLNAYRILTGNNEFFEKKKDPSRRRLLRLANV